MVKHPGGSLALKLLLLQDALKVFHALLGVFHMSRQVAVEEADGVAKHWHAGTHTTFIPLKHNQAEGMLNNIQERKAEGEIKLLY